MTARGIVSQIDRPPKEGVVTEMPAYEVEKILGRFLDRVEKGEDIVITRRGKPVARVAPLRETPDKTAALAVSERLLASRAATLDGITLRELIDEGRR